MEKENYQSHSKEALEEELLQCCRLGDAETLKSILANCEAHDREVNLNCVGKGKGKAGWTPLHMACFFGHLEVAILLLMKGSKANLQNDMGETPLHLASYTGRTDIVLVLLNNGADVAISNGDGHTAQMIAKNKEISRILKAAFQAQMAEVEAQLLKAAREGDIDKILHLINSHAPPDLNCRDNRGNTPLHCAAYRGHVDVVNYLIQQDVNRALVNSVGKTAAEISKNDGIRKLINTDLTLLLKPRMGYQGYLEKRINNLFGWKRRYFVLEECVLTYYKDQVDALSRFDPMGALHIAMAVITPDEKDSLAFTLDVNSVVHFLRAESSVMRQSWVDALESQRAYFSRHYMIRPEHLGFSAPAGAKFDETLKEAENHRDLLAQQIAQINDYIHKLCLGDAGHDGPGQPADPSAAGPVLIQSNIPLPSKTPQITDPLPTFEISVSTTKDANLCAVEEPSESSAFLAPLGSKRPSQAQKSLLHIYSEPLEESKAMLGSVNHCLDVVGQQEKYFYRRLEEERKRRHILEEVLSVLAAEHNLLEARTKSLFAKEGIEIEKILPEELENDDSLFENRDTFFDAIDYCCKSMPIPASSPQKCVSRKSSKGSFDTDPGEFHDAATYLSDMDEAPNEGQEEGDNREEEEEEEEEEAGFRKCLPCAAFSRKNISVWSILKQSVGKDLSKVSMPVHLNEPLSFLQRLCEDLEYCSLLETAAGCETSLQRLLYVAAFAISTYSTTEGRVGKPFNPLLGETFELVREDMNMRVICEQVSHHPPVSALDCESSRYRFWEWGNLKNKFWGKSLEIIPQGGVYLEFFESGEVYSWRKITTCVHNIIYGDLWVDNYGEMEILNHKTHEKCVLHFKPQGWFGKEFSVVEGSVYDSSGVIQHALIGKWTESVASFPVLPSTGKTLSFSSKKPLPVADKTKPTVLWRRNPRKYQEEMFHFTNFAISLNDINAIEITSLCPTDSRLRPDQRFLEEGDLEAASNAKNILEENQRKRRRLRESNKIEYKPLWFQPFHDQHFNLTGWKHSGQFWLHKEKSDFSHCPSLFES